MLRMPTRLSAELHNPFFQAMWGIQGIAPVPLPRKIVIFKESKEEKKNK